MHGNFKRTSTSAKTLITWADEAWLLRPAVFQWLYLGYRIGLASQQARLGWMNRWRYEPLKHSNTWVKTWRSRLCRMGTKTFERPKIDLRDVSNPRYYSAQAGTRMEKQRRQEQWDEYQYPRQEGTTMRYYTPWEDDADWVQHYRNASEMEIQRPPLHLAIEQIHCSRGLGPHHLHLNTSSLIILQQFWIPAMLIRLCATEEGVIRGVLWLVVANTLKLAGQKTER